MTSAEKQKENTSGRIRVCFVCPKAYPLFNPEVESVFGGAEVDIFLLARELAKDASYEVSCVTADYGQPDEEIRGNVRIIKSLTFREDPLRGAFRIWQAMKKADSQIYMLEAASAGVVLAERFCRRYKRKLVYRTASSSEVDGTYQRRHRLLFSFLLFALRRAFVVTQNRSDQKELLSRYDIHARIIPNGQTIPDNPGAGPGEFVLWVGRSDAVKRPELFLELAGTLPGERFVMICPKATGDEKYEDLKGRAAGLGNLEFIERISFDEIDLWYSRAKVLVNTSVYEGFPNTFIQAAKWQTAVLSLAVNPDDVLSRFEMGICSGGDWNGFVPGLMNLLRDQRYRHYGRKGYEYVSEHHDITRVAGQYKTLFEELVDRGAYA